jgi:tetratricopeptide (TPR) repeat protein
MNARWICGLAVLVALSFSSGVNAGEQEARFSIGGRFRDDEPLESREKRNLELRELIREATVREPPPLHLGEVAFDLEKILPVSKQDSKNSDSWTIFFTGRRVPRIVQFEDGLVLIEKHSSFEWVTRSSLVTPAQLEEASTTYLGKHPQEANAFAHRAVFRAMRGRTDEAISDITRAVNLRPENVTFLFMRGAFWLSKEQLRPALDDLDETVALAPENPNVYLMRAAAFIFLDDPKKAFPDLSEAIRLGNRECDVFMTRGCIHLKNGDYAAAEEDLTKALEYLSKEEGGRDLKEAFLHYKRAFVYHARGRLTAAIAEYTLAIEREPAAYEALFERGGIFATLKEYRLALADIEEAIRLQPERPDGYSFRGQLRFQSGDYDKALDDFSAAISLDPGSYQYWMWRARVRFEKKDFQGSVEDLTKAFDLNMSNTDILESRAVVFDRLGEAAKAAADRNVAEGIKRFRASRDEFRNSLR